MPEYLAPGVYVEETSFRSKIIEGVSTTTTGFIGPCRFGPVTEPLDVVTSLTEFETIYAGGDQLEFADPSQPVLPAPTTNFLWQAVRAFFTEGGTRLYVSRVFRPLAGVYPPLDWSNPDQLGDSVKPIWSDGHARATVDQFTLRSRFPGAASNIIVGVTVKASQNILGAQRVFDPIVGEGSGGSPPAPEYTPSFGALSDHDLVVLVLASDRGHGKLYVATYDATQPEDDLRWRFQSAMESPPGATQSWKDLNLVLDPTPNAGDSLYVLTLTVSIVSADREHALGTWSNLPPDPQHSTAGEPDSIFDFFEQEPASLEEARTIPLALARPDDPGLTGIDVVQALVPDLVSKLNGSLDPNLTLAQTITAGVSREIPLTGGNDGARPGAVEYEGIADPEKTIKTGLKQFEDVDEISIVAAPGSTDDYDNPEVRDNVNTIFGLLIAHAETLRYRIAVLDSPPGLSIGDVRRVKAKLDSKYAALYYPWVTILDPITRAEIELPPSGFVAGIYARNDIQRGVWKAPANEVVNLALGFEQTLNKAQQEVLNPEGINCFRYFENRGFRLWGARTISSDPEWKYVNVRRYFAYLEHSIDKGTQWAVFEPNGYKLWANVRRTIQDFLLNEWQQGALLGEKPEQAYFVRCDRTTMTQNDLDNGRLVCLIGVAPLYPAEFVIFRIGQWTADAKV